MMTCVDFMMTCEYLNFMIRENLDSFCMEEVFKADFAELFSLTTKDAHSCMKNEED